MKEEIRKGFCELSKYISIMILALSLSGCSGFNSDSTSQNNENTVNYGNPSSYQYSTNSRFKVVSVETIDDGTTNGENISILVDKETKIMYMQTQKFQSGYGLGLEVMVDKDGKPVIYNSDLK